MEVQGSGPDVGNISQKALDDNEQRKANGLWRNTVSFPRTARTGGILVTGKTSTHGSGILHHVMGPTVLHLSALPGKIRATLNLSVNHSVTGKMPVEVKGVL